MIKRKMKLNELCTFITDGAHHSPPSVDDGKPIASVKDMMDYDIDLNSCRNISDVDFNALVKGNCQPKIGDVLIAKDGSYLKKIFVVEKAPKYVVLSSIGIFRPDVNLIHPYYLNYYFHLDSFRKYVENGYVSGTALKRIVLNAFKRIEIEVPSLQEQERIISKIKPFDDKIRNNEELILNLRTYIKLLFHKWFYEYKVSDKDKPNHSGELPKGWGFVPLDEVIETIIDHRGKTPNKLGSQWSESENGIIALSAKIVKGGELINLEKANRVDISLYNKWMSEKLKDGDILMTSEAPLGEFYFIFLETEYCLSQRLFAIRGNEKVISSIYLYHELSEPRGLKKIKGRQSGSTVFGIRQEELRRVEVLLPPIKIQKEFEKIALPIFEKIRRCEIENRELRSLRDLRIMQLIS